MADIAGSNGRRLQLRAQRKDGWTAAKRATFLSVLAATCNATAAARAVGKAERTARSLRERDGEFSQLWEDALATGYQRLEEELLARALGLSPSGDNPVPDDVPVASTPVAFDPALAIKVLQMRGNTVRPASRTGTKKPLTQGEIDALLLQKLDALAERQKRA